MPSRVTTGPDSFRKPLASKLQPETVQQIIFAIDRGDTLHGLLALECSPQFRTTPAAESYLAYCMAKERGQFREAIRMCQAALAAEPHNPAHYLNLGRVFLLAQDKTTAIATFWKGISDISGPERGSVIGRAVRGHSREHGLILGELRRLGMRKKPPFARLPRSHPLNRIAGKLLAILGLR
jgi:tetratricopeptide (TPR) repeat protein